jgi:hypothetical protein
MVSGQSISLLSILSYPDLASVVPGLEEERLRDEG